MKAYHKNQQAAQKFEETRKSEMLEKSLHENLEIRKKTKKEVLFFLLISAVAAKLKKKYFFSGNCQ